MNVFTGIGRIGRDADVRYTPNGTAVANFPLAVDAGYGQNKSTLWMDCALFGKRAEGGVVPYLVKGAQVGVSGEINLRQFEKRDGGAGAAVSLKLNDLSLVGGRQNEQQNSGQDRQQEYYGRAQPQRPAPRQPQDSADDFDDDIPF